MNCNLGDLAICVAGCFAGSECEVIAEAPAQVYLATGEETPGWIVAFSSDMPWPQMSQPLNAAEGWYPDKWLRPLKSLECKMLEDIENATAN